MEQLEKIFSKIEQVSQTDYVLKTKIIEQHWVDLMNKKSFIDINQFNLYVLVCSVLAHALVETRDKEKALKVINNTVDIYQTNKNKFEIDFKTDLFYDKLLFDKVVCLYWLGKEKESNKQLKMLRKLKPDVDTYKIWEEKVSISKLYEWDKILTIIASVLITIELILRFFYGIKTHAIYAIVGLLLLGFGYYLKKKGTKKKTLLDK